MSNIVKYSLDDIPEKYREKLFSLTTNKKCLDIIKLRQSGLTYKEIDEKLGLKSSNILFIEWIRKAQSLISRVEKCRNVDSVANLYISTFDYRMLMRYKIDTITYLQHIVTSEKKIIKASDYLKSKYKEPLLTYINGLRRWGLNWVTSLESGELRDVMRAWE